MHSFKRLALYMKPYWWRVVIAAVASTIFGAMDASFAYFIEPILRKIFVSKDMVVFSILPVIIVILFLIRGICKFLNEYFMRTAGELAIQDIRKEIYNKSLFLGLRFFGRHKTGSLMSRVMNDVAQMQNGIGGIISGIFRDGLGVVGLLAVIFYRNWQLAIISFMVIPATIYPSQLIGKKIKQASREAQAQAGDLTAIVQETYSGIKVVKAFALESFLVDKFKMANDNLYSWMRKSIKYNGLSSPIMEVVTSFGIAAVVLFGGMKVMSSAMTATEFFSFITAMALVYSPVKKLNGSYYEAQRCLGAAERVFEIVDQKPEIIDSPNAVTLEVVSGKIEFESVSFDYDGNDVLKNISITADKGEVVALVGPSGAGKTTLVSLIPRFYDVSSGCVLIDSIDVRDISRTSLMSKIALVDQETILFNETISNNIRYGNPYATDGDIESAARAAFAHDFIMEMPDGYQTQIGDRGVRLSGGQRQRICIARAILKNAPILILDEATSALDTESEQMVQQALDNLMSNRTTFVIAHRLSTVLHADKIMVMEHGQIVECGNHEELLLANGLYSRLCSSQFGRDGLAYVGE